MIRKKISIEKENLDLNSSLDAELMASKENEELLKEENHIPYKYDDSHEHTEPTNELLAEEAKTIEEALTSIKGKCKFKQEYVDQNVVLSVNHLKQYFFFGKGPNRQKLKAVHDVSFQVYDKEVFGIVGESGCGKTTTGRSIIRLYNPTSGSIYYKGYRIGAGSRWNEKEIKFTNIRYHKKVKELKAQLAKGEITKEVYDEEFKKATELRNSVVTVQKAKIKQIKYDDKHANDLTVNGDKIKAIKQLYKEEEKRFDEQIKSISAVDNDPTNPDLIRAHNEKKARLDELNGILDKLKSTNHKLMREIQMIFQDPIDSLDPRMTVESIISEGLQIQGSYDKAKNHQKVVEALERVGLIAEYADRYPHEFSGGQRQRIGIARALIMNPKLLICDEPISALDVSIRAQVINLLNDLKEELGLTIIFIAHDLSVVKYFCDRIAVMYFGEIVEMTTSDELFKHPLHPYTKSLLSAIPKPNPLTERKRKRIVYNPQLEHDYTTEKPSLVEIIPGHFVLANAPEIEKYKKEIEEIDKGNIKAAQ